MATVAELAPPASVVAVVASSTVDVAEPAAPPASVTVDEPAAPSPTFVASSCARPPTAVDSAALVGLLGYDAAVMIGVATWNAAAQLVFALLLLTVTGLLVPVALMAAFNKRLHLSAVCAKMSAVILTGLFVVAVTTRFGHWGNVASVPSAIVVTGVMTGVWIRVAASEGEKGEEV